MSSALLSICRRILVPSVILLFLSSCHVTPYQRTLPEWIQRVYVPMADNKTYEPGLEELVTKAFQKEIVADGRLELMGFRTKADAVLKIELLNYRQVSDDFENDRVEETRDIMLTLGMKLYDPKDMKTPIGTVKPFTIELSQLSDYRSSYSELNVDARERVGETAGMRLVRALMSNTTMVSR